VRQVTLAIAAAAPVCLPFGRGYDKITTGRLWRMILRGRAFPSLPVSALFDPRFARSFAEFCGAAKLKFAAGQGCFPSSEGEN